MLKQLFFGVGQADPWHDLLGYETGDTGSRSDSITKVFYTTVEKAGPVIFLQTFCQAHSALGDKEGMIEATNYSIAQVQIHSIKITFFCQRVNIPGQEVGPPGVTLDPESNNDDPPNPTQSPMLPPIFRPENGTLNIPNVYVPRLDGGFDGFAVDLTLAPGTNPYSFTVTKVTPLSP